MRKRTKRILFIAVLLLVFCAGGFFGLRTLEMRRAPEPKIAVVKYLESLCEGDYKTAAAIGDAAGFTPAATAETVEGKNMAELIRLSRRYTITSSIISGYRTAQVDVSVSCLAPEKMTEGLAEDVNAILAQAVENAVYSSEVYTAELNYKSDVIYDAFNRAMKERETHIEDYSSRVPLILYLDYDGSAWHIRRSDVLSKVYSAFTTDETADEIASELFAAGTAAPEYVRKHYEIAEGVTSGPAPDRSLFGETDDPAVITELLKTPYAVQLLEGQETAWNENIERIPDSLIRYYLDETILVIEWQEEQSRKIATYTEIMIADGSQLRRKIVNDSFDANEHLPATELSAQTNAVMALSGDFYDLGNREFGIVVYDGEIRRYEPYVVDTCFVNSDGDLIFSYQGQLADIDEARKFVQENDIVFSLCFGPVLIDDFKNTAPDYYPLGEFNETYARCGLGQLGKRHYLTANLNLRLNSPYVCLATGADLADAMMKYRCEKAYTLDGGQTAETIINNELINDVQFGRERPMSDIIYFATAIPSL